MANFDYIDYLKNNQYVPSMNIIHAPNNAQMSQEVLANETQRQLAAEGFGSMATPSRRVHNNRTVIGPTTSAEEIKAARETNRNNQYNGGGNANAPYIEQLNSLYDQIMNRKPFQYDLNGDLLYRQMADQYTQLGQQAMRDTMGQAAALTGGYGNSYAQQVGNQAYQQYLTYLNEQIPGLYDRAYGVWQDEGDRLLEQYQLAAAHPGYLAALQPSSGGGGGAEEATEGETEFNALAYAAALGSLGLGGVTPGNMSGWQTADTTVPVTPSTAAETPAGTQTTETAAPPPGTMYSQLGNPLLYNPFTRPKLGR